MRIYRAKNYKEMSRKAANLISAQVEAIKITLYGPVTPSVPASILQIHPDVTIVADEAALSLCEL